jgi:hypothetical protein
MTTSTFIMGAARQVVSGICHILPMTFKPGHIRLPNQASNSQFGFSKGGVRVKVGRIFLP